MRIKNWILLGCLIWGAPTMAQDAHTLRVKEISPMELEEIIRPGRPFRLIQYWDASSDSIIGQGNIEFRNSNVGLVEKCSFKFNLRNDSLNAVVLQTDTPPFTTQLIGQANAQYGQPEVTAKGKKRVYTWKNEDSSGHWVQAKLMTNKKLKSGTLHVQGWQP